MKRIARLLLPVLLGLGVLAVMILSTRSMVALADDPTPTPELFVVPVSVLDSFTHQPGAAPNPPDCQWYYPVYNFGPYVGEFKGWTGSFADQSGGGYNESVDYSNPNSGGDPTQFNNSGPLNGALSGCWDVTGSNACTTLGITDQGQVPVNASRDTTELKMGFTFGACISGAWKGALTASLNITGLIFYGYPPTQTQQCENCATGNLIADGLISATNSAGISFTLSSGITNNIMIEPYGAWQESTGLEDHLDLAISTDQMIWFPLNSAPDSTCQITETVSTITGTATVSRTTYVTSATVIYLRVNSDSFTDNTGSMLVSVYEANCGGQCGNFSPVDTYYESSVPSNMEFGDVIPAPIYPGDFYALQIVNPPWRDGGPNELSYRSDIASTYPVITTGLFTELDTFSGLVCSETLDSGSPRIYFQAQNETPTFYSLRAHDIEDPTDWSNNTSDVHYKLETAEYVPPPAACEATMGIVGVVQGATRILSNQEQGTAVPIFNPIEPHQWYALVVYGGPWLDGDIASRSVDVSPNDGVTWYPIEEWEGHCVSYPAFNTIRAYFYAEIGEKYRVRVHDDPGDYADNTGEMTYELYLAENMAPPPGAPPGNCSATFTISDTLVAGGAIPANLMDGDTIFPSPASGWYALEIVPMPWMDGNSGGMWAYDADISDGPHPPLHGMTWSLLGSFPGAACVETVAGYYTRVFFEANPANAYRLRAHDPNMTWSDNVGNVNFEVYNASNTPTPPDNCQFDFDDPILIQSGVVTATLSNGVKVLGPIPAGWDRWYELDTGGGPWHDNATASYEADFTINNGVNWGRISDGGWGDTCVVQNGNYTKLYFHAGQGYNYRLRAHDEDTPVNFGNNSDEFTYDLYGVTYTPRDPAEPPDWGANPYCFAQCVRPQSTGFMNDIFHLGTTLVLWGDYAQCSITKFLTWCPYHTAVLTGIQDEFGDKEPFRTVISLGESVANVVAVWNSYDWGDTSGGADSTSGAVLDFWTTLPDTSPYMGAPIDIMPDLGEEAYSTFCSAELINVVGTKLTPGICFMFDALDHLGLISFLQFVYDVSLLAGLLIYVEQKWIKPAAY